MIAPFCVGQLVIAVDAMPGSYFKNGTVYTVAAIEYKQSSNPIANGAYFWYIGIIGHAGGVAHFRPSIFAPITEEMIAISFEKITEENQVSVN